MRLEEDKQKEKSKARQTETGRDGATDSEVERERESVYRPCFAFSIHTEFVLSERLCVQ